MLDDCLHDVLEQSFLGEKDFFYQGVVPSILTLFSCYGDATTAKSSNDIQVLVPTSLPLGLE